MRVIKEYESYTRYGAAELAIDTKGIDTDKVRRSLYDIFQYAQERAEDFKAMSKGLGVFTTTLSTMPVTLSWEASQPSKTLTRITPHRLSGSSLIARLDLDPVRQDDGSLRFVDDLIEPDESEIIGFAAFSLVGMEVNDGFPYMNFAAGFYEQVPSEQAQDRLRQSMIEHFRE